MTKIDAIWIFNSLFFINRDLYEINSSLLNYYSLFFIVQNYLKKFDTIFSYSKVNNLNITKRRRKRIKKIFILEMYRSPASLY